MAINTSQSSITSRENPGRKRVWRLLPVVLLLSIASAYWGIRHIEKQVLAAAPLMLRDAGVDPTGLRFQADYRDITVTGQLPEGVTSSEVRELLEQNRGAAGEDIRRAAVVAAEWIKTDNHGEVTAQDDLLVSETMPSSAVKADATDPDGAQTSVPTATPPRVNILLAEGKLTMSGHDVSRPQVDRLLAAAAASVGQSNVKQQWQVARLSDTRSTVDTTAHNSTQVEPLAGLVALLGDHATAASITLENNRISGSVEASSGQSVSLLKARGGDGVVVTSAVNSERLASVATGNITQAAPSLITKSTGEPAAGSMKVDDVADLGSSAGPPISTDNDSAAASGSNNVAAADNTSDNRTDESNSVESNSVESNSVESNVAESKANEENMLRQEISALQIEIDALQQQLRDDVFFVHDSSAITREALPVLDKVSSAIKQYRRPSVKISGHTDSVSSRSYNLKLSKHRAAAVKQFLIRHGVDPKRLRSEGYGEDKPVVSNKTKPGRRLNRRVEFTARKPFGDGE